MESKEAPSPTVDFAAGTVAVKVRLQVNKRTGDNAFAVLRNILKEEKVAGLFKGVMSPMWGVAAVNASVFAGYGTAMRWQLENPNDAPSLLQVTIAGSASGIFTSLLTTPIERLKVLQQTAPTTAPQPTLRHLLYNLPLRSLYRGFSATILRDLAYGPYFFTYELVSHGWPGSVRTKIKPDLIDEVECDSRDIDWGRLLLAGGAAGIVGWGCTFPMDVIKSRIQATEAYIPSPEDPSKRIPHPCRTVWSTAVHAYKTEGAAVFTTGLGPTLLRSIPVNMVCFIVFEAVVSALR